jgi:hypothetical protein
MLICNQISWSEHACVKKKKKCSTYVERTLTLALRTRSRLHFGILMLNKGSHDVVALVTVVLYH